jgi:hypothetical protein
VLILIAAFLVVLAVLGFGFLSFVTEQRNAARKAQVAGLMRMALTSGRAHAIAVIDAHVPQANPADATTLGAPWATTFAATTSPTTGTWPSPASHPDATARLSARQTMAAADHPFARANAIDLWRHVPGLASPAADTSWHGFDQGTTVHDGTGRWFDAGYYDRNLRVPQSQDKAQYRLRYAVAVIDQQGLIAFNKQRYEHRRSASPADTDAGDLARRDAWYTGSYAVPAFDPVNPTTTAYNDLSDPASGFADDADGTNAVRINTWRPIPCDHRYLASSLLAAGFGIRDVQPGFLSDGDSPARGTDPLSVGQYRTGANGSAWAQYRSRTPGSLPDHLRRQGYKSYTVANLPATERYGDYLPFEALSMPVFGTEHFASPRGAQAHILRLDAGSSTATIADPWDFPLQSATNPSAISGLWPAWAGPAPSASSSGSPNAARYLRELSREMVRNRHHAHLTTLVNMQQPRLNTTLAGSWTTDMRRMLEHQLIQSVDVPGWQPIAINLRLSGSGVTSGSRRRVAGPDDGILQTFTPFATAMGIFDTVTTAGGFTDTQRKNLFEMGTQFPVNLLTAPPLVLEAVVRLVCPELPHPDTPASVWISADSDADAYARSVTMVRKGIETWRTATASTMVSAATTPNEWLNAIPDTDFRTAVRTGQTFGSPGAVGIGASSVLSSTARMGLSSSILGGLSRRGPMAAFRVRSATWANGTTALNATSAVLVIEGAHASRLFSPQMATNPDLEHRIWLRMTGATAGLAAFDADDPRPVMPGWASSQDRRIPNSASAAPAAAFLIAIRPSPTAAESVRNAGATTIVEILIDPNTPETNPYITGYGQRQHLAAIIDGLSPYARAVPGASAGPSELLAFIDFASERWRPRPPMQTFQWLNFAPGLCFVTGKSRTYRIAVRARLENMDDPADVLERSWDLVYRSDPDRSGSQAGSTGFLDGDVLYQDEENVFQNAGGIIW